MIALMRPLKSLTNVNAQFQRGMAACQTLFSILDMEQEKDTGTREVTRAKGDIEFRNVTFYYPGKETPALRDINLSISEGKTVALVGRSGSGKSTIANLLTRFYDVQEGRDPDGWSRSARIHACVVARSGSPGFAKCAFIQ
jgi:ATP-binding cassette, subfamily B, bacterial MsbA